MLLAANFDLLMGAMSAVYIVFCIVIALIFSIVSAFKGKD